MLIRTTPLFYNVMSQLTSTLLVAGMLLIAGVSVGTSAFTTAEVDRQANVDVVADETGLLGLTDGNSGNLVFQNSDGQLGIDFTNGSAAGANTNALFKLGDPTAAANSQAFIITNNDAESHVINASYSADNPDAAAENDNLKFAVYDGSNTLAGTISAAGATDSWTAEPNAEYYVVITVDTGHNAAVISPDENLSGTLEFRIDDNRAGGN